MSDQQSRAVAKFEGKDTRIKKAKANGTYPVLPKNPWTTFTPFLDQGKKVSAAGVPPIPRYTGGTGIEPDLAKPSWGVPLSIGYNYVLQRIRLADPCGQGLDVNVASRYDGSVYSPHVGPALTYWMTWNFNMEHMDSNFRWDAPMGITESDSRYGYSTVGFSSSDVPDGLAKIGPGSVEPHTYSDVEAPSGAGFPTCREMLSAQENEWANFASRMASCQSACNTPGETESPKDTGQVVSAEEFASTYGSGNQDSGSESTLGTYPTGANAITIDWSSPTKLVVRCYFYEVFDLIKISKSKYYLGDVVVAYEPASTSWPTRSGGTTTSSTTSGSSYVGLPLGDNYYTPNLCTGYYVLGETIILTSPNGSTGSIGGTTTPEKKAKYKVMKGTEVNYTTKTKKEDWGYSTFEATAASMDYFQSGQSVARHPIVSPDFTLSSTPSPTLSPFPQVGVSAFDLVAASLTWTWLTLSPTDDKRFQSWVTQKSKEWGDQADQIFGMIKATTQQWVEQTLKYLEEWYANNVNMRQQWYDQAIGTYVLAIWNIEHPGKDFDLAIWTQDHPGGPFPTPAILAKWDEPPTPSGSAIKPSLRISVLSRGPAGSGSSVSGSDATSSGAGGAANESTQLSVNFNSEPPPPEPDPNLPPVDPTDPYDPRSPVYDPTLPPKLMEFNPPTFPYEAFLLPNPVSPGFNCQF